MKHIRPAIEALPEPVDSSYDDLAAGFAWAIARAIRAGHIRTGSELANVVNHSLIEIRELDGLPEVDSFCFSFAGMAVRDVIHGKPEKIQQWQPPQRQAWKRFGTLTEEDVAAYKNCQGVRRSPPEQPEAPQRWQQPTNRRDALGRRAESYLNAIEKRRTEQADSRYIRHADVGHNAEYFERMIEERDEAERQRIEQAEQQRRQAVLFQDARIFERSNKQRPRQDVSAFFLSI